MGSAYEKYHEATRPEQRRPLKKGSEDILLPVIDRIDTTIKNAQHKVASGAAYISSRHREEVDEGLLDLTWCSQELARLKRMIHNYQS